MSDILEQVRVAFRNLMGINGDPYIKEIKQTGQLSEKSYLQIVDNVSYNSLSSIFKYFGVIQYYYYQSEDYKNKSLK